MPEPEKKKPKVTTHHRPFTGKSILKPRRDVLGVESKEDDSALEVD